MSDGRLNLGVFQFLFLVLLAATSVWQKPCGWTDVKKSTKQTREGERKGEGCQGMVRSSLHLQECCLLETELTLPKEWRSLRKKGGNGWQESQPAAVGNGKW